jgi:hypothetical protein
MTDRKATRQSSAKIYAMPKANLTVFDSEGARRQEVQNLLRSAADDAKRDRNDGAIVILTRNNALTGVRIGGTMLRGEAALMQLYRLSMNLAIDHEN